MKKRLKITHEIISPFKELLVNEINGTFSFNPQNRNGEELSDFLSTCELLPSVSELIQQRDELLRVLKGLVSDVGNLLGEHDFEWQQAGYFNAAKELINKIENNE